MENDYFLRFGKWQREGRREEEKKVDNIHQHTSVESCMLIAVYTVACIYSHAFGTSRVASFSEAQRHDTRAANKRISIRPGKSKEGPMRRFTGTSGGGSVFVRTRREIIRTRIITRICCNYRMWKDRPYS